MGVSENRGPYGSFKGFLKGIYTGSTKGLGFREFPKMGDPTWRGRGGLVRVLKGLLKGIYGVP